MNNSLLKEKFYKNLTPPIQERTISLLNASKIKNASQKISTFIYCAIGVLFIYYSRNAFFTEGYFFTLENIFKFTKLLIIISGSFLITPYITKVPEDNYSKAVTSLKNQFFLNICNCKSKCSCKNELAYYLKKQGINLFK